MARTRDLWKNPARRGHGKRWLAVWTGPDGAEHTKAFGKKGIADKYGPAQETDADRGVYVDPKGARITVGQWCDTWLTGYQTRRPRTVAQARVHIRQIKAEFGAMRLGQVRPSGVKAWCSRLRGEGAAVSYVYALHSRLSQIMGDAVHDGLLGKSPCSRRTSPGAGKQRPYVATTDQVWALCEAMPAHLRAAILLAAFAGLRVREACGLRVSNIDFMRGIIHPVMQYPAEELKTEISRTAIPIPRSMTLDLSAHVKVRGADINELVLGVSAWVLERDFREARKTVVGLPEGFRYHDLRHYFASLLIADGADVKTVQARLRHASAVTTLNTYGHLWPDRDESTRATVEAVFSARAEQSRNKARPGSARRRPQGAR
jgi:integrase